MSLEIAYSNNVKRKKEELIRLRNERAKYTKKLSDASQKILRAEQQLKSTKSSSTINSKINEINRESKKKVKLKKRYLNVILKLQEKKKNLLLKSQNY